MDDRAVLLSDQTSVTRSVIQGHPSAIRGPEKYPEAKKISAIFSVKRMQKLSAKTRNTTSTWASDSLRRRMFTNTITSPCRRIPILRGIKLSLELENNLTVCVSNFITYVRSNGVGDKQSGCQWLGNFTHFACGNSMAANRSDFDCNIPMASVIHSFDPQSDIRGLISTTMDAQIVHRHPEANEGL